MRVSEELRAYTVVFRGDDSTGGLPVRGPAVLLAGVAGLRGPVRVPAHPVQRVKRCRADAAHIMGMRNTGPTRGFPAGALMPGNAAIEASGVATRYAGSVVRIDSQAGSVTAAPHQGVVVRSRKHKKGIHPIVLLDPIEKTASEVDDSDFVGVPVLEPKTLTSEIDLSRWVRSGKDSLGRGTFGNRAVKTLPINRDTAWLIGLYVAEGDSSPNVRFSLSSEEDEIMDRLESVAASLGYTASRSYSSSQKACAVTLGAVVFGRWLKEHCGGRAQEKHIPDVILTHGDPAIRKAFIDGLIDGDGCRSVLPTGARRWILRQSSRALMHDTVLLLAQDEMGAHISEGLQRPRSIRGRALPLSPIYSVSWNPDGARLSERTMNGRTILSSSHRWKPGSTGVWYPVKSVLREDFDGFLYEALGAAPVNGLMVAG
ncbi:hypothetical protein [Paenarthrobacter sp. YJN-5]|uniref:hypothetical protein n=1 Tax=Paenarthrobacter sp. YJN-5 TaxID=2735316 RepID=UPI001877AC87|nr:hypothetical protein [Paenarthrobacter sp. YJN-5]QOT19429.1 hypothetical protein HMI59_22530 [Paenarthrobacter sp. YJN-5]